MKIKLFLLGIFSLVVINLNAQIPPDIIVAEDGSGDYKTITEAINSLPMFNYKRTVIYIKSGVYNEKIRIERDNLTLRGESREKTIITFNQLRSDWDKNPDSIGPGVINIHADDIIIDNVTVENSQPEIGPHAFAVYGFGTRTILINANFKSKGADTVSLWDYKTGMYYHANCYFEGAVDFVCPRGWCYIKDSKFFEHKATASVWHAGGHDKNQKFVIVNSFFDGVKGFELGRHHYEAQFYFIDCSFSENMSYKPIYRVTYPNEPGRNRPFNWGERYYFFNCVSSDIDWATNNLIKASGSPSASEITPAWTFDGKWDPEKEIGPQLINHNIEGKILILEFDEFVSVIKKPILISNNGTRFKFSSGGENNIIKFFSDKELCKEDISGLKPLGKFEIFASGAYVNERYVDPKELVFR